MTREERHYFRSPAERVVGVLDSRQSRRRRSRQISCRKHFLEGMGDRLGNAIEIGLFTACKRPKRATQSEKLQANVLRIWRYFNKSMAISAVQIWICTAFSLVPTNVLILRDCLRALKNSSICQRSL